MRTTLVYNLKTLRNKIPYFDFAHSSLWLFFIMLPLFLSTGCVTGGLSDKIDDTGYVYENVNRFVQVSDDPEAELLEILVHVRIKERGYMPQTNVQRIIRIPYKNLHLFEICGEGDLEVSRLKEFSRMAKPSTDVVEIVPAHPWMTDEVHLSGGAKARFSDVHQAYWDEPTGWKWGRMDEGDEEKIQELNRIVTLLKDGNAVEYRYRRYDNGFDSPDVVIPWHGKVLFIAHPSSKSEYRPGTRWKRIMLHVWYPPAIATDLMLSPVYVVGGTYFAIIIKYGKWTHF